MRRFMRERRIKLGLSQKEVAELTYMTRANYAHIERGRHEPSIEQMEVIAKALRLKKPTINFFKNFCDETYQESEIEPTDEQSAAVESDPKPAA